MKIVKKSEFQPISSLAEARMLDPRESMDGYWHGMENGAEPDNTKSRAYHHGWRNGLVDGGFAEPDTAQISLMDEYKEQQSRVLH
ncbi:hypothetical protein [Undibacterium sp. Xuan67W]|uniref:hypothetical protein n=1 Tax=Undibacterium sp. Xuan67W TaxID=3413057 RepID=UPI003BF20AA7